MRYFKRYWDESTGDDLTDSWGNSWFYFETDDELNVIRQIQLFENGQALKYDPEYLEDKLGGLAEVPLDDEFFPFAIEASEFEWVWNRFGQRLFPEIVITEDTLWGQPRLDGRRLAVGDIVSHIDINNSLHIAAEDYDISLAQARQALLYCRNLQCVKDNPLKFCHNCTLRVKQEGESYGEEQDNWKRADLLFKKYFNT